MRVRVHPRSGGGGGGSASFQSIETALSKKSLTGADEVAAGCCFLFFSADFFLATLTCCCETSGSSIRLRLDQAFEARGGAVSLSIKNKRLPTCSATLEDEGPRGNITEVNKGKLWWEKEKRRKCQSRCCFCFIFMKNAVYPAVLVYRLLHKISPT